MTHALICHADEEDEYMGDNFMSVCQSLDEEEACDVTAQDRFHGLRVAHPHAALKIREGLTIGSDASCGITLEHSAVSPLPRRSQQALCVSNSSILPGAVPGLQLVLR